MPLRGERVRERRKQLGMSQEDLAQLMATDQKQISVYENGRGNPTADNLVQLAQNLETTTDYLLGLTDDPKETVADSDLSEDERAVLNAYRNGILEDLLEIWMKFRNRGDVSKRANVSKRS